MKSLVIKLDSIDKVKEFVKVAERAEGDLDLVSNRYTVDAKSIMGILSLNLSESLTLNVHNAGEFEAIKAKLAAYIA